jgi:hypothetical protein
MLLGLREVDLTLSALEGGRLREGLLTSTAFGVASSAKDDDRARALFGVKGAVFSGTDGRVAAEVALSATGAATCTTGTLVFTVC